MNGQEYLQQLEQRLAHYYDKKPLPKAPAFVLAAELNAADEVCSTTNIFMLRTSTKS